MSFWQNLSGRERMLLGVAAALLAILATYFLGVRPVLSAKAKAEMAQTTALRDLESLQNNLPKLSGTTATTGTTPFNRNNVIQLIQLNDLELARLQPENNGAIKLWFNEATTAQIYKLVADVTEQYAAKITSVQISRKSNGLVSATITISATGA